MKIATITSHSGQILEVKEEQPYSGGPIQELIFFKRPTKHLVTILAPCCLDLDRWKVEGGDWQTKASIWPYLKEACRG